MTAEKRLATRVDVDWPAVVTTAEGAETSVRVVNASIGGLRLATAEPLGGAVSIHATVAVAEEDMELHLSLVPAWTLRTQAGALVGARFAALEPSDHECLKRIISQCLVG
ncbi:MAG: hypothetical protein COZ06_16080 [Armatimonadetes bacterium CG_4_10_14_3_um_filter_66_18]|nr:PilZ domain-containing protein [Armatimonadota bacterium]OIP01388.1 MAG: hypothetical protein AUJ96_17450 [Armatimonadetes bacterium CG2_30_66_41]PIX46270.1 MAG: hypothetical protein COZ57_12930 [Armatimonadetes bacterium CG_4_8_14_3_um_filter_66_20]PIY48552.1 MAG: hypothetical protein COZ06_16080 [Armatimonadetes bacterium CG_4_10_14_3_um_filter_66_18]PIZ50176.1 MAG: hypothetical protein COY42_02125 [Armatimonadetes bacterium CG_4_10_14_0_8_um_filter_66_14]PJB74057.1 MAG: hypothetical prot